MKNYIILIFGMIISGCIQLPQSRDEVGKTVPYRFTETLRNFDRMSLEDTDLAYGNKLTKSLITLKVLCPEKTIVD